MLFIDFAGLKGIFVLWKVQTIGKYALISAWSSTVRIEA